MTGDVAAADASWPRGHAPATEADLRRPGEASADRASIGDEIFAALDDATPAERRVGRALLAGYPGSGLVSASRLAKAAGTSTPTVLRLIGRLGYSGYPEFQARLRDEVSRPLGSPAERTGAHPGGAPEHTFARMVAERIELLEALTASVPPGEFERAVELLSAPPVHTVVSGGYFSRYLAMLLATQLDDVIPGVDFAADPLGHDVGRYLRLNKKSVAVVLDLRRHEQVACDTARLAHDRGARVILLTDPSLSSAATVADVVLPVPLGGLPFDSMTALLAVVEMLVGDVLRVTGADGIRRMRQRDDAQRIARTAPLVHAVRATPTPNPSRQEDTL